MQTVREVRIGIAEHRGPRAGPGRIEAKRIRLVRQVVRQHGRHDEATVSIGRCDADSLTILQQGHGPALEDTLGGIDRVIEVRVVPYRAAQDAGAGHGPDGDGDAGLDPLHGIIPRHPRDVRHGCCIREVGIDDGPEPQDNGLARLQRPVHRRVVGCQDRTGERDAIRKPVHPGRLIDVGEVARIRRVQVVGQDDVERGHGADVLNRDRVLQRGAREHGSATDHGHGLDDAELLRITNDHDGWLGPRRRVAVAVRQQVLQFVTVDGRLVRDQRAGRNAVIDAEIELHDRGLARRQNTAARAGRRWRQVRRTDGYGTHEREHAAVRLTHRQAIQGHAVRDVRRIAGYAVEQLGGGRRNRPVVVDGDRIAKHVTGIDDTGRTPVDLEGRGLCREQQRQLPDDVHRRIVDYLGARVVGRLVDDVLADRAHEGLVRDHEAVRHVRIDDHIERDRRDIVRHARIQHAGREVLGRIDLEAVGQRRVAGAVVRERGAIQRGAARDISRVRGCLVDQRDVGRVLRPDVLDRDRVPDRFAGQQDIGVSAQVLRDLLDTKLGSGSDANLRRVFVARDIGIRTAVNVRIVAVRQFGGTQQVRLVLNDQAIGQDRRQRHVELDLNLATGRHAQVAHVDNAGAVGPAIGVGVADVRPRRGAAGDEPQRAGHEHLRGVEQAEIVVERDGGQRRIGRPQAQRVAQRITGCRRRSRADSAGQVLDGFLEEVAGQRDRDAMGVLVVQRPDRAVRQRPRVRQSVAVAGIIAKPGGNAGQIGQCDVIVAVVVDLGLVSDDQALARADRGGGTDHRQLQPTVRRGGIAHREIDTRCQRPLPGYRRQAVGREHLGAEHAGREIAHAARGPVRQHVDDRRVPRLHVADVPDVEREIAGLAEIQGRGAGLGQRQFRRGDRHRRRDSPLARQRLVEHAVDQPSEVPLGGVDELGTDRVGGRIVQNDRDLEDNLLARRDDREVVERQKTADIGEGVRHRRAGVQPVRGVTQVGQIRAGRVQVIPDRDAVQVVDRTRRVDRRAGRRIEQDGQCQPIGKRHTDRDRSRTGGILLVDLLDGYQQVLAALLDRARRAVGEPDLVAGDRVACHLTDVHDVVEHDEPAFVGLAGLSQEAKIGR